MANMFVRLGSIHPIFVNPALVTAVQAGAFFSDDTLVYTTSSIYKVDQKVSEVVNLLNPPQRKRTSRRLKQPK
jgi:hypothetical protein